MAGTLTTREPRSIASRLRDNPLEAMREEIEDLATRFWGEGDVWPMRRISPRLDLSETDRDLEIRMNVPGVKPSEIDVQVSGNLLTISGEHKEEREEKGRTYHRVERSSGSFSRSIQLPCAIKEDKIEAECQEGVLTVTLPKTEEAQARRIKVKG